MSQCQHLIENKSEITGYTRGPPPEDVVQSSPTNAEHMDPSHNIKDIIKQHQPASTSTPIGPAIHRYSSYNNLTFYLNVFFIWFGLDLILVCVGKGMEGCL